jgi:HD-GYP domain-containing protein (c-di-GMP phosphodiesterase class II)
MRLRFREQKLLLALVTAQSLCLASGLWVQQRFHDAVSAAEAERAQSSRAGDDPATARSRDQAAAIAPAARNPLLDSDRIWIGGIIFVWIVTLQTGAAWLVISRMRGDQAKQQSASREEALRQMNDLVRTRDAVVFGLAKLAESRDSETGLHLERISAYSTRLAAAMSRHPRYRSLVTRSFVNTIGIASALHDIGKVGVEDAILLKQGPLTPRERDRVQRHTKVGADCIRQIERRLGTSAFLQMARDVILHHHERWDGTGYPDALAGGAIPLAARIVAIADVYDALATKRVYKESKPHEECVRMIREQAGKQFDPELIEIFLSVEHEFRKIAERFAERSAPDSAWRAPRPGPPATSEEETLSTIIDGLRELTLSVADDAITAAETSGSRAGKTPKVVSSATGDVP